MAGELKGTLQGTDLLSFPGMVDPQTQALINQAYAIAAEPPPTVDFSKIEEMIQAQQAPAPRPTPGVASPLGIFFSLLAANVGGALARTSAFTQATQDILDEQRRRKAAVEEANRQEQEAFRGRISQQLLNTRIGEIEKELDLAIQARDTKKTQALNTIMKVMDDWLQRRRTREAQTGETAGALQLEGARRKTMLEAITKRAEAKAGAPGFEAWPKQALNEYNRRLITTQEIADRSMRYGPNGEEPAMTPEEAATWVDQRTQSLYDDIVRRYGLKGAGEPPPATGGLFSPEANQRILQRLQAASKGAPR